MFLVFGGGGMKRSSVFLVLLVQWMISPSPATAQLSERDSINYYFKQVDSLSIPNPELGFRYAQRAFLLSKDLGNIRFQIKALSLLGQTSQNQSKFKESISYYHRALTLGEKHKLIAATSSAMNGIGISYYYLNDLKKSEHYILRAAFYKKQAGEYDHYSSILTNLAGIYFSQGKYEKAMSLLREVETVVSDLREYNGLCNVYNTMGSIQQLGKHNLDSAKYYFERSLELSIQHKLPESQLSAYHNLGGIQYQQQDFTNALINLNKSLNLSKSLHRDAMTLGIYRTLSELYVRKGDYKEALRYKELQLEISNSIFKTDKQKAIAELDVKYETSQKEKQIQEQEVKIQQAKNNENILIFAIVIAVLLMAAIVVYFRLRKRAQQRFEEEKTKLFENIVHEIRTPLSLINGPLQLIKQQVSNDGLAEQIEQIERNSDKLVDLVNELLDASKLEKGHYQLAYHNGNVSDFVENIVAGFRKEAELKNIDLHFYTTNSFDTVSFPANAFEKIVTNIVANALKYSPKGSLVTVSLTAENAQEVQLIVSDNGPGIPQQHQAKIFTRFYRVQNENAIPGTGIGLSLVKELVALLKGTIQLKSEPGKGTEITIRFPVQPSSQQLTTFAESSDKPNVLLVEDDAELGAFVSKLLEPHYTVAWAKNGHEGILQVEHDLPDLVLTDVMMPVKDGIQLLQRVKEQDLTNHIPVVIFSAKSSLESRLTGLKFGADAYLGKPFNPDELVLIVQNLLLTAQRNRQQFQQVLKQEERSFDERVKGTNAYTNQAIDLIISQLDNTDYSVNELATDMHISRSQLHRKLQTLTGFSTTNFIKMVRLEKAKDMLKTGQGNVTEVAYSCGFSSQSYFTKSFTEYFGEPPSKYGKPNK